MFFLKKSPSFFEGAPSFSQFFFSLLVLTRQQPTNAWWYSFCVGIANKTTIDIQELAGTKTPSSTLNGANNKGIFRNQAKAVDAACATRPDLRKKALARVSAIHKAGRVARAKK